MTIDREQVESCPECGPVVMCGLHSRISELQAQLEEAQRSQEDAVAAARAEGIGIGRLSGDVLAAELRSKLSEAQREIEYQKSAMVHARSRVDALSAELATSRTRDERLRQLVEQLRKLADDADARKRENDDSNVLKAVYWAREARTYRARADELSALLADPIPGDQQP